MNRYKRGLLVAAPSCALSALHATPVLAQAATRAQPTAVGEVIVTANKRQENIQNVGASSVAPSGDKRTQMGVPDTAPLQKIVPGLNVTPNYYGTSVFTIRGVGFQD